VTAVECLDEAKALGSRFQQAINAFVDDFRAADQAARFDMTADAIERDGPLEALVAATVSALCREVAAATPAWVAQISSPEPFFAFPARSFALRLRLMIESPPAFRVRNVFVPENYLSRA
jgi:hypothetical protein